MVDLSPTSASLPVGVSRRAALLLGLGAWAGGALALAPRPALGSASTARPRGTLASGVTGSIPDYWSTRCSWRTSDGGWGAPIHITLNPDGSLLLVGWTRSDQVFVSGTVLNSDAYRMAPGAPAASVTVTLVDEPVDIPLYTSGAWYVWDELLCAGHAHMADGSIFIAGGSRTYYNTSTLEQLEVGLAYGTRATNQDWVRLAGEMQGATPGFPPFRWYPGVTRLPDGRMLITTGTDMLSPVGMPNLTVETYTPSTGAWTVVSSYAQTPIEIWNSDYTHTFVLPQPVRGFDLISIGEPGVSLLHSSSTPGTWSISQTFRPGSDAFQAARLAAGGTWDSQVAPNFGASTVLLPIRLKDREWGYDNGSILTVGGPIGSTHSHSADVYSPVSDTWQARIDIGAQRHYPSTVLLPTGQVLIVNGASADAGVTSAHYINLMDGSSSHPGADAGGDVRGYHSLAMLLPDGRVLVGSGRDAADDLNSERSDFRYYYPYYMFLARPTIVSAPASVAPGATFTVTTRGNQPVEAILTGLGSMTHSVDMNQRWIQVQLTSVTSDGLGGFTCSITAPSSAQMAPPGPYLLWILDAARTPSLGQAVQLMPTTVTPALAARASHVAGKPAAVPNVLQQVTELKRMAAASGAPPARPEFVCPIPRRPKR